MSNKKKYYVKLDYLRIISCIAIFLYHLNILKGGYLAVCTFFVLSGYLSCKSLLSDSNIKNYYIKKVKHIYIPLVIVTFISISVISLIPNTNWFNLKPETTSVLLSYNNYWQLSANLDYFARHTSSPFMHLWYISILIQFDIVFPLIFIIIKKLGEKIKKQSASLIAIILGIIGTIYFYIMASNSNIMTVYYNTLTRVFSLFFGVTLAFRQKESSNMVIHNKILRKIVILIYYAILITLFILIDAKSNFFIYAMIIVTITSTRLIDYLTTVNGTREKNNKHIQAIANMTYEIYLVQYPLIFIAQYLKVNSNIKLIFIIVLTILISAILKYSMNLKSSNHKSVRAIMLIALITISLFGAHIYIISKDYTNEMKALEAQLSQNEKLIEDKQNAYMKRMEEEQNSWNDILANLESDGEELENTIKNLNVVGIGDSVMLGAIDNLYEKFPNGYFDAKISRTAWVAKGILDNLSASNMLGEPIVFGLGANGDCTESCKREIITSIGNRKAFWINVTNDLEVDVNRDLQNFTDKYDNLYLIDWNQISSNHPEYFVADGIHLTEIGRAAYTNAIYDAIYNIYTDEYNKRKNELLDKHEKDVKSKIGFYGNDLLLNAFEYIETEFPKSKFSLDKDYTYDMLYNQIENEINDGTITHKIVFAFDNTLKITKNQYEKLIRLCEGHEIYILTLSDLKIENDDVTVIDFQKEIDNNKRYMLADNVHLSDSGNIKLSEILKNAIKNN